MSPSISISRDEAARQGAETLAICERGEYVSPRGLRVEVREDLRNAQASSESFPEQRSIAMPEPSERETRIEVWEMTTLAAARAIHDEGGAPVALNFASARNPGGGFLNGARAQEESLCRNSALYVCIRNDRMYDFHRGHQDLLYTGWMLYSPAVPVLRAEDGTLLERPWPCTFVTAPAPNTREVLKRDGQRGPEIARALRERIARVLALCAERGHSDLVLGAWGCGAFGGSSELVAGLFSDALRGPFRGVFERVVFAIIETNRAEDNLRPFEARFGARRR